jgi:hypothetical protein
MNPFVDDASSGHEIMVTELGDDVLLLDHLDFLDNDLEIDERKVVEVLEEDPEPSHRSTVDDLHQLRNVHVLIALETLVSHVALMSEFFEDVRSMLMALVASVEDAGLFSQSG